MAAAAQCRAPLQGGPAEQAALDRSQEHTGGPRRQGSHGRHGHFQGDNCHAALETIALHAGQGAREDGSQLPGEALTGRTERVTTMQDNNGRL